MTTPLVCPGRENQAWRRARVAYAQAMTDWENTPLEQRGDQPAYPDLEPSMGEPFWCRRCHATIRARLTDLDDLAALAAATADGMRATGDQDKISGTPGNTSPSPVQDMLDALYRDLVDIEDWHREDMRYEHRPHRGRSGAHARTLTTGWLLDHLDGILTRTNATDAGETILTWHAKLQAATRSKPDSVRVATRCPRCQLRSLKRRDDGYIHCDNLDCCRIMSEDEHTQVAEEQANKQEAS